MTSHDADTTAGSPTRGERLAAWLEQLGLAEQLAAAGLPSFTRDRDGGVRWTDPGTGRPLTGEQIDELDTLLHADGDEPTHAVPVALVQLRLQSRVRSELLASDWLDYAGVAARRGVSENAARFAVHKAAERGALLVVPHDDGVLVPAFQLDDAGEVREELRPVLAALLSDAARNRVDPWQVWGWLVRPAALLGGAVPAEAVLDPEEAPLVQHAALRLAERAR